MTETRTEKEEILRGEEARRVLAEPLLQEAFRAIEETLFAQIKKTDVGDFEAQRDLIVSVQLLAKVRTYLENVVLTGRMAAESKEKRTLFQRLRRV